MASWGGRGVNEWPFLLTGMDKSDADADGDHKIKKSLSIFCMWATFSLYQCLAMIKGLLHHARREATWCVTHNWLGWRQVNRCFYTIAREVTSRLTPQANVVGSRAIWKHELLRSGTTPQGEACLLTTHQWEVLCFWNMPPELSML